MRDKTLGDLLISGALDRHHKEKQDRSRKSSRQGRSSSDPGDMQQVEYDRLFSALTDLVEGRSDFYTVDNIALCPTDEPNNAWIGRIAQLNPSAQRKSLRQTFSTFAGSLSCTRIGDVDSRLVTMRLIFKYRDRNSGKAPTAKQAHERHLLLSSSPGQR